MAGWAPVFDRLAFDAPGRRGWIDEGAVVSRERAGVRPATDTCSGARSGRWVGSCAGSRACLGRRRDAQVAKDVLEAVVAEHRAVEARWADVDAAKVEQVVGADGRHLVDRLALDLVRQERGARLADGAAATGEGDAIDDPVLHAEHQRDPVATERIRAFIRRVGIL